MKHKKLVLAYSGGLDTSYCLMKLSQEGYEVHAISVNTGGFDATEVEEMETKALQMGAHTFNPSMLWTPFTTRWLSIWFLATF
jgi:argininosuccinate synthase